MELQDIEFSTERSRSYKLALQWHFQEKEDIGKFLSLLHSNKPEFSQQHSLDDAERLLGIKRTPSGWALNWPMTVMTTTKA
ncbi:hypothetical protein ACQEXU_03985 [Vibrio sp. TRT 21S02]|uniref:hypothetical protein n=1 Tax=Vibrio sp. TRT 21S02 TaxID=3418507 RepID=UPI003CFAF642